MSLTPLPAGPSDLTASWLTESLRESVPFQIEAVETTMLGDGLGFTGQVARLALTYRDGAAAGPRSLIAKFPPADPAARAALQAYGIFEREVRFYQDAAPRLGLRVPRPYLAAFAAASDAGSDAGSDAAADTGQQRQQAAPHAGGVSLLLLEDLAPATPCNTVTGVSPSDAAFIVRQMASFHASWWESADLRRFAWLGPFDAGVEVRDAQYQEALRVFAPRVGPLVPAAVLACADRLVGRVAALKRRLAAVPSTFVHGDFHPNNLFLSADPPGLGVIDWQVCCRGPAVWDLMFFLVTALRPADRQAHEAALIRAWHDQLAAGGVKGYPLARCRADARVAVADLLYFLVMIVGLLDFSSNAAARDFRSACVERIGQAVMDHGADLDLS
jgi:hypothetical protein